MFPAAEPLCRSLTLPPLIVLNASIAGRSCCRPGHEDGRAAWLIKKEARPHSYPHCEEIDGDWHHRSQQRRSLDECAILQRNSYRVGGVLSERPGMMRSIK